MSQRKKQEKMANEKVNNWLTAPTLVPSLKATLLDIPVGESRTISCETFSYVHVQSEATRLTKAAKDRNRHKNRMFSVSSSDKGHTVTVTRNW